MFSPSRSAIAVGAVATAVAAVLPLAPAVALVDDMLGRPELAWTIGDELQCDDASCELIVYDGAAYVLETSADSGRVVAFAADGTRLWSTNVTGVANMSLFDDLIYLEGPDVVSTIDRSTGSVAAELAGSLVDANVFETMFIVAPDGRPSGVDGRTGEVLWTYPASYDVAATCHASVVLAGRDDVSGLTIVDHRTGVERAVTDHVFDPATDTVGCWGLRLYVAAEGELSLYSAADGWLEWSVVLSEAPSDIEYFGRVVLVTNATQTMTQAFDRDEGLLLWEAPPTSLGVVVSSFDRVRADRGGFFLVDPYSGQSIARSAGDGQYVGFTGNRMVVFDGSVITAYGVADLGEAWRLELDEPIDDVSVHGDLLVTRSGSELRAYR